MKIKPRVKLPIDRLSVSGMMSFLRCPRQYELNTIIGIRKKRQNVHTAFGTSFHKGAEPIWRGKNNKFIEAWNEYKDKNIDYLETRENWGSMMLKGRMMLDSLEEHIKDKIDTKNPIVELSDPVKIKGVTLSRRLDLITSVKKLPMTVDGIDKKVSGGVQFDLKTSSRRYGPFAGKRSTQLQGYAVALESAKPEVPVEHSAFLVVTKARKPEVQIVGTKIDKKTVKTFMSSFLGVVAHINTGHFPLNPGDHCNYCDFKNICFDIPGWKKLYEQIPPRETEKVEIPQE
jgi:CRISPR/Cas system-associated exonuclease Cas4 (RecB family)